MCTTTHMDTELVNDHRHLDYLPGFRFHPTEEELVGFYLKNMVYGSKSQLDIIGYVNIYLHNPWDLPGLSIIGEREWYFFVPRDRKHGLTGKPNRITANGFWKATGSDRKIMTLSEPKRVIGLRKTLVFYKGRAPTSSKTDWIMNEYRLCGSTRLSEEIVLCKIYRKATSLRELEQRASKEEALAPKSTTTIIENNFIINNVNSTSESSSFTSSFENNQLPQVHEDSIIMKQPTLSSFDRVMNMKKEDEEEEERFNQIVENENKASTLQLPIEEQEYYNKLSELQVPEFSYMDYLRQDSFVLNSPWLQNLTSYANIFNS